MFLQTLEDKEKKLRLEFQLIRCTVEKRREIYYERNVERSAWINVVNCYSALWQGVERKRRR